jgi:hypothetical protein
MLRIIDVVNRESELEKAGKLISGNIGNEYCQENTRDQAKKRPMALVKISQSKLRNPS